MDNFQGYIGALYRDLKEAFESNIAVKQRIDQVIDRGLFEEVRWESPARPFKKPYCNLETKQIFLDEGFLSYLWCVSCFFIGIIDIYHEKVIEDPYSNITKLSGHRMYRLFDATLGWGRSLRSGYSPWPDYIPNPTNNTDLSNLTNRLWFYVVRYVMYHELGHLAMHSPSIQLIKDSKKGSFGSSAAEVRRLRIMEKQADDYALETLLFSDISEYDRYLKYLAATVAYLSGFFSLEDGDTRSKYHPDIDDRLQSLLKKISGLGEFYSTLLGHTTTVGLQVFMAIAEIDFIEQRSGQVYQKSDDLQRALFEVLDELKAKYHILRPFR